MTKFAVARKKSSHDRTLTIPTVSSSLLMLLIAWLSLLLPVQAAAQTSTRQPVSTGSLTALKTLSPITIDGNLNESVWSQANFVTFSNPLRSDNTVKVSVLWDDANLYFAYDVTDAELEALNDIDRLFLADGAEIYIDAQNNKGIMRDANDYAFFASINDLTKPSTISAKTLTKLGGYTMEIVIPWSAIATVPVAGKVLGLLLANNDRDFEKSFQFDWLGLINTGSYNRPNLWGNLMLSGTSIGSTIPPLHPPITATLLGQTGEDVVGTRSLGRNGVPDVHVRLSGVSGTISNIRITELEGGIWEMPLNAQGNWLVATVPTADPSVVDAFFDYYKSITAYTLAITYTDGQSQTVVTTRATFDFSLSNTGDKSVNLGSSVTNAITGTLVSGSSQQVSFSIAGLPAGATGSFSQTTCNASCSSVLTVSSTAGTSGGTFPITVTATGSGVTKTTTFLLTVLMTVATPAHAQITATLLGQTGEDVIGTRSLGRNGVPDVHVRLSGVSGTFSNIRITGLDGVWVMPLNANNWLVATVPTADPSVVDVFFDYAKPISTYTLAITYTDGQSQTVVTSSTSHPPITATFLGQTGEDVIGTRSLGRNGVPDVHVRLSGVSGTFSNIRITGLDGVWVMPLNANNWLVATVPTADPSVVDVFFDYAKPISTYTLAITYTDGQSQTVVTSSTSHPPITATFLGQTGEDIVGTRSLGLDGVPDVHVRLSGVSGTISKIRVTGLEGIWEMPLNSFNWLVAIVPTGDPSVVDVFFDYFKPITTYTLTITYSDGQSQTVDTTPGGTIAPPPIIPIAFDFSLSNAGNKSLSSGSSTVNTITASLVSGSSQQIALSAVGLPAGATAGFSQVSCNPNCSSQLTLNTVAATPAGSFLVTVTATGGGITRSTSFNLTMSQSTQPFDFSLSNSGGVSLNAGSSINNTTTANLVSGTSQPISFSIAGLPSGTLASLSSGTCSPNCSTLVNINSSSSTAPGNYPISITASGGGLSRTTSFTLSVVAGSTANRTYCVSSGVDETILGYNPRRIVATIPAAPAGNDNNSGIGDGSNPASNCWKTLQRVFDMTKSTYLHGGDTLILRGGEYNTAWNGVAGLAVGGGGASVIPSGTDADHMTTFQRYGTEKPVFRMYLAPGAAHTEAQLQSSLGAHMPTQAECAAKAAADGVPTPSFPWGCWSGLGILQGGEVSTVTDPDIIGGHILLISARGDNPYTGPFVQYIKFDGISFDAKGIAHGLRLDMTARHLVFDHFEIANAIFTCVSNPVTQFDVNDSDRFLILDHQWLNGVVHHCGAPFDTNMVGGVLAREHPAARFDQTWYYHAGGVLWDNIETYAVAGAGISPLGKDNTIRNSYFHNNNAQSLIVTCYPVSSCNWQIYNNVFVTRDTGVELQSLVDTYVFNNTFVADASRGGSAHAIYVQPNVNSGGNIRIENNIIIGYETGVLSDQHVGNSTITLRNNLIRSITPGREIVINGNPMNSSGNILGQDPKFVNPSAEDYRLQAGSPAIGTATDGGNIGAR